MNSDNATPSDRRPSENESRRAAPAPQPKRDAQPPRETRDAQSGAGTPARASTERSPKQENL